MFSTFIKKTMACTLLLASITIAFFSCQKELSVESAGGTTDQPADLSKKVTTSVISGIVTDENNLPVKNASVQLGSGNQQTDRNGYFKFYNTEVVENAALVVVNKAGYFKAFRTFTAFSGKGAFFRIKLIPKTIVGTVSSATGGNVTLSNGLKISLPAEAVVNAVTNAAYSGPVSVAAYWINPEAADLEQIMPGDLRGINTAGALKIIKTYGMAAVELTGSAGEKLQIATGKKAGLSFPLPASLAATAPASIPLWHFDEIKGLWKEEGSAVKTGNAYVGEVSHFSYWNCDIPLSSSVNFNCTIVDPSGAPLPYLQVSIYYANNQYTGCHGCTDSVGFVGGAVPANQQLIMVVSNSGCSSSPLYTQAFTTTGSNISLGTITLAPSSNAATITGTAVDCSNSPLTSGYIILNYYNSTCIYSVNPNGTFTIPLYVCSNTNVSLAADDAVNQQQGSPQTFIVVPGSNAFGNIMACGLSSQQFVNYTINGSPYSYIFPTDSVNHAFAYVSGNLFDSEINGFTVGNTSAVKIDYDQTNVALNSIQNLTKFSATQVLPDVMNITTPIGLTITEYGSIGQFISGNFSGILTGNPPTNTPYNVTCSFRVRRNF